MDVFIHKEITMQAQNEKLLLNVAEFMLLCICFLWLIIPWSRLVVAASKKERRSIIQCYRNVYFPFCFVDIQTITPRIRYQDFITHGIKWMSLFTKWNVADLVVHQFTLISTRNNLALNNPERSHVCTLKNVT